MEQLLVIQPENILKFKFENNQYIARIVLQNVSAIFVAFKIRLSNQNDYRVKPSIGVLRAGNSVKLQLTTENAISINIDRVQIMAGSISNNEVQLNQQAGCNLISQKITEIELKNPKMLY
ncbi:unnamed protein product [Paramecium sonneborni]|uniref:MSP domain-containing protein n=1 Tax=Paramecium sonneborni TaxID=65129 RepID=A0A8S1QZP4_9CILI|nr:unnamed protein product [Paramecium sonneborni]